MEATHHNALIGKGREIVGVLNVVPDWIRNVEDKLADEDLPAPSRRVLTDLLAQVRRHYSQSAAA